jgi:hypothetical protein
MQSFVPFVCFVSILCGDLTSFPTVKSGNDHSSIEPPRSIVTFSPETRCDKTPKGAARHCIFAPTTTRDLTNNNNRRKGARKKKASVHSQDCTRGMFITCLFSRINNCMDQSFFSQQEEILLFVIIIVLMSSANDDDSPSRFQKKKTTKGKRPPSAAAAHFW